MRHAALAEAADAREQLGIEIFRPVDRLEQALLAAGRLVDRRDADHVPLDVLGLDLGADLGEFLIEHVLHHLGAGRLHEGRDEGLALRIGDRPAIRHHGEGLLRACRARKAHH